MRDCRNSREKREGRIWREMKMAETAKKGGNVKKGMD